MLANHVFESAIRQLLHGYREFPERDTFTTLIVADSEGLNPLSCAGTVTLKRTANGFTIKYDRGSR